MVLEGPPIFAVPPSATESENCNNSGLHWTSPSLLFEGGKVGVSVDLVRDASRCRPMPPKCALLAKAMREVHEEHLADAIRNNRDVADVRLPTRRTG